MIIPSEALEPSHPESVVLILTLAVFRPEPRVSPHRMSLEIERKISAALEKCDFHLSAGAIREMLNFRSKTLTTKTKDLMAKYLEATIPGLKGVVSRAKITEVLGGLFESLKTLAPQYLQDKRYLEKGLNRADRDYYRGAFAGAQVQASALLSERLLKEMALVYVPAKDFIGWLRREGSYIESFSHEQVLRKGSLVWKVDFEGELELTRQLIPWALDVWESDTLVVKKIVLEITVNLEEAELIPVFAIEPLELMVPRGIKSGLKTELEGHLKHLVRSLFTNTPQMAIYRE